MLYLAQVRKYSSADGIELTLLAEQRADQVWAVHEAKPYTVTPQTLPLIPPLQAGMWVLVDCDETGQPLRIQDAQDWVLSLLRNLAAQGDVKQWLQSEESKIEQWRQELTLKSQEMSIKNLELETRRERFEMEQAELEKRWQAIREQEQA
ncbi:MAG: hypothetical protein EA366_15225 [Spirulina sp. DLM2.Bin59]|nr:MAG: hypothetical protein EA366_15225 [Spirulina sp. DLM2.Bin59]